MHTEIPDHQITCPKVMDSVIGKQFDTLIKYLVKEVQFYNASQDLSETEEDAFFKRVFDELDNKLELVFRNMKIYAENYQKTDESSMIESDIMNLIEKEKYLDLVMNNYKYLKSHCSLNEYERSAWTKKIETTVVHGIMALCQPIYNHAILQAYENWPDSLKLFDWKYYLIVTQLYNDKLINPDEISNVQIASKAMYVNGEKQSDTVFFKYRNLYAQYFQEERDLPFEMNVPRISKDELYLNTDDILNKGTQEWNSWRAKNIRLIPAINNYDSQDKNLKNVNFSSMQFENYNFKNAILDGADFQNADIINCDFSSTSLIDVDFTEAKADKNTRFPVGFKKETHGLVRQ
jgi:hypothetical protein